MILVILGVVVGCFIFWLILNLKTRFETAREFGGWLWSFEREEYLLKRIDRLTKDNEVLRTQFELLRNICNVDKISESVLAEIEGKVIIYRDSDMIRRGESLICELRSKNANKK